MSAIEKRNQYAAQILAGFAANPAIFAHNSQCGWSLVNCTDDAIAAYAVRLANALLGASDAIGLDGNPIAFVETSTAPSPGHLTEVP